MDNKQREKCHRCACNPHCGNSCDNCENCDVCECSRCLEKASRDA